MTSVLENSDNAKRGTKRKHSNAEDIYTTLSPSDGKVTDTHKVSTSELLDEIQKIDPTYNLTDVLLKKRRRIDSIGRKIYNIIEGLKFCIKIKRESFKTIYSVIPKEIDNIVMFLSITPIMYQQTYDQLSDAFSCTNGRSTKYPLYICKRSDDITMIMDIESLDIPNEIVSLNEKSKSNTPRFNRDTLTEKVELYSSTGNIEISNVLPYNTERNVSVSFFKSTFSL